MGSSSAELRSWIHPWTAISCIPGGLDHVGLLRGELQAPRREEEGGRDVLLLQEA